MILIAGILATYGISTVLTTADGPYGVIYKLKQRLGALKCFMCSSVWVGAFFALLAADSFFVFVVQVFAFSGGAILLDRMVE